MVPTVMARKLYATAFPLVDITVVPDDESYATPTGRAAGTRRKNTSASAI